MESRAGGDAGWARRRQAGPEAEMVKPRGRRRGGCEVSAGWLIEELVSQQLMACFCRENNRGLELSAFPGWDERCTLA